MSSAKNVRSIKSTRGKGRPEEEAEIDANLRALCVLANGPLTVTEIAELTGLSHGGVHDIQRRALRKIRCALARDGYSTWGGMAV